MKRTFNREFNRQISVALGIHQFLRTFHFNAAKHRQAQQHIGWISFCIWRMRCKKQSAGDIWLCKIVFRSLFGSPFFTFGGLGNPTVHGQLNMFMTFSRHTGFRCPRDGSPACQDPIIKNSAQDPAMLQLVPHKCQTQPWWQPLQKWIDGKLPWLIQHLTRLQWRDAPVPARATASDALTKRWMEHLTCFNHQRMVVAKNRQDWSLLLSSDRLQWKREESWKLACWGV